MSPGGILLLMLRLRAEQAGVDRDVWSFFINDAYDRLICKAEFLMHTVTIIISRC